MKGLDESIREHIEKFDLDKFEREVDAWYAHQKQEADAWYARQKAEIAERRQRVGTTDLSLPPVAVPIDWPRSGSKTALAVDMLRRTHGASLEELMEVTGWTEKSIRGFLSGTVKGRLRLDVKSEKTNGVRRYRIQT
jgi:hypothetical protein